MKSPARTKTPADVAAGATEPEVGPRRHWPPRRLHHKGTPGQYQPLMWAEDILQYCVAIILIVTACVVLVRTVVDAATTSSPFAQAVPHVIDSILFVIIVLEIFTTVMAHFRDEGLQLRPFLVIGIISAVRHILIVGARSSLGGAVSHFQETQIELGVNAGIVFILVVALVLVHRHCATIED